MALINLVEKQIKQQLTGQDLASAVHSWSSALISRHFAVKRYTRDEDDGEEDAFAGMEGDDGELEETVFHFHDCWKTQCVVIFYFARLRANPLVFIQGRGLFHSVPPIVWRL